MLRDNEFDRQLLERVHPGDWRNPTPAGRYNLVVLGAGTAGLVAAAGAAGLGARVALVEKAELGGDCLNIGCVPSKALLRSAHALAEIRRAEDLGLRISGEIEVDFPAIMNRVRAVRARISPNDSVERFDSELGVDVFLGAGHFTGRHEVEVAGERLRFRKAVIATGARAAMPNIPGLAEVEPLTNENVFDLEHLPGRLLVLGAGPIGCELAQAFRRFGSEVTLIEMDERFLAREDPEAAQTLLDVFRREGLDVRLSTRLAAIEVAADGEKRAQLENPEGEESLAFDEILVAVGRNPNIEGLGLDAAGVASDPTRGIEIDDFFATHNPDIYAAGDCALPYRFTHAADFAARAVIQNALFSVGPLARKRVRDLQIPRCTYTDPEVAHIGLDAEGAHREGIEIESFVRPFSESDRAIAEAREEGFVKIHTRKGEDRILGATIVGAGAGDLIGEIAVAMAAPMGLGELASVIHPYPTRAEAIRQLGDAYRRTRLTPGVEGLFEAFLRWRR